MKIAIDCRIASYTSGGTAVYVRRLVERFAAWPDPGPDEFTLLEAAQGRNPVLGQLPAHIRSRRLVTPSHHRWEQLLLPLELALERFDLLHSPDFIPPFRRRYRSVITVHDLAFLRYPQFLTAPSRRYFNGQIRAAVQSADRIIAVSNATKQDLIAEVGASPGKIDVVYEAADPLLRPEADRAAIAGFLEGHRLPGDYVLFVGTLEPRKNLPVLIQAFATLRRKGYAGQLVLAGARGWLYDQVFSEIERLELQPAVVLAGPLEPGDLRCLYNGARLLAFPSVYEGFGLPVLEAMSCGLPVVTSNVSSLPEVAGDAALLVDPSSPEELATAMERVLGDPSLADSLRQRGLARAGEFSWERAAAETLAVYHRAA
ncbi:MAG: glycosyltransferase family 4 protein [Chloroflexota bacterium]|nr:glycosyltransferase family 4 protein [Chloroflexota bacterium]